MASTYELIVKAVDQTSRPLNKIEKALKSSDKKTTKLNATLKKTKSRLTSVGKAGAKGLGSLTKGLGVAAVAATAAAGAFAFMAKSTINTLDTLGKTASKLGVTTEFLSKYQVIANRAGISTETFNMGLQRFLRRLGEAQQGTGELLKPLAQMGINMKDSNGNFREGTDVFAEYMNSLAGMTNSTQKLAYAMKGFDSEGVAMVNIADMGAKKIAHFAKLAAEAGMVISEDLTKAAEKANDKLSNLMMLGKGFKMQFFGALSETISELSEMLQNKIKISIDAAGGMKALALGLAAAFLKNTRIFITETAKFIDKLRNAFAGFVNVMQHIIVAISNIPGVGFDAVIGNKGELRKQLAAEVAAAQANIDAFTANMGNEQKKAMLTGDYSAFGPGADQAMQSYMKVLGDATLALAKLDDGSTMFFTQLSTDSKKSEESLAGVTKELLEQEEALVKKQEAAKVENELNKELAKTADTWNRKNDEMTDGIKTNTDETDKATESKKKYGEALKSSASGQIVGQIMQEKQSLIQLRAALANVSDISQITGISVARLTEEFTKAIEAITGTDEATKKLNKTWENTASGSSIAGLIQNAKDLANLRLSLKSSADISSITGVPESIIRAQLESEIKALEDQKNSLLGLGGTTSMFDAGLTPQQNLDMLTQEIQKEAELLQMKKDMLALAGPENEAAVREALGFDKKLNFQKQLVKGYTDNHEALEKVEEALANVSQLALDAGVSEKFLTETLLAQQDALEKNLGTWTEKALTTSEIIENGFSSMANSIGGELATAIRKGEGFMDALSNAFTRTLDNILQQIITSQINSMLAQMFNIGSSGGGGGLGSLITGLFGTPTVGAPMGGFNFSGFRATGGPVSSGKSYLVGESGKEVFTPNQSGSVTANNDINSGNKQVVFNINAVDTQTGVQFLLKNKPQIINMVSQGFNQRGRQGITS